MLNLRVAPQVMRARSLALFLALAVLSGCAGARPKADGFPRPFDFGRDTMAYSNELSRVYHVDAATGRMTHEPRQPKPSYALHCFAVAKAARLFFQHARFDADLPRVDDAAYRTLVRRVARSGARAERSPGERIVIPGFASLREFSRVHEALLKAECGTRWASYFQRGNWRMTLPFSRRHQRKTAEQLLASVQRHRPPVVHVEDFPKLHINHALLVFDARADEKEIEFAVYDPNDPSVPGWLRFNRAERRFYFPANFYFAGGRVNIYEIYHTWAY